MNAMPDRTALRLAEPAADGRRWYIVTTHTGQEARARFHLERQRFEVYLPMRMSKVVSAREVPAAPLFPRYLFVHLDPNTSAWWAIRSTLGVAALISTGTRPAPMPTGFIERLRQIEVDGLISLKRLADKRDQSPQFEVGQAVRVDVAGEWLRAVVEERVDSNRVRLLLAVAGGFKPMRVTARQAQLQSLDLGVSTEPKA
jgi:transcriptional antiterminator RfaH